MKGTLSIRLAPLFALLMGAGVCAMPGAAPDRSGEIPVAFSLDRPGFVTLVIEDADGHRVRNLLAGQYFEAGSHTVPWDGRDEGTAVEYQRNDVGMVYEVERAPVAAGTYRVRGIVHEGLGLRYEGAVMSPGTPPWHTVDGAGAWLADHTPPVDVLYLPEGSAYGAEPQMMVAAPIAEAGHALMWITLDGKKLFGKNAGWEGGYALARDAAPDASAEVVAYAASVPKRETLILYAHRADGTHASVFEQPLGEAYTREDGLGLAVYGGIAVVSLPHAGLLRFIDLTGRKGRVIGEVAIARPRGLFVEADGRLFVVTGDALVRMDVDWAKGTAHVGSSLATGLADPHGLTGMPDGRLFVSEWGTRHQVRVFGPDGTPRGTIGTPGVPGTGRYDPTQMRRPGGLAVDGRGRLWVAEVHYAPKRLSVWQPEGLFVRAFYGPPKYGGGGVPDPLDPTRLYYASGGERRGDDGRVLKSLMTLKRHPGGETDGQAVPEAILLYEDQESPVANLPSMGGESPVDLGGHRFLVNSFNQSPRGMKGVVAVWREDADGRARLVAAVGYHGRKAGQTWLELNRADLRAAWPPGADAEGLFFAWSDLNRDEQVSADELQFRRIETGPGRVSALPDLSIVTSWMTTLAAPTVRDGVPVYDLGTWQSVGAVSRGDADVIREAEGWTIHAGGPIRGFWAGEERWHYHNRWYDRAKSPGPGDVGELVETARVIGFPLTPPTGEAGAVWAIASDKGGVYLFTVDGLFLGELGGDLRTTPLLRDASIQPGSVLGRVSFGEEHFWPTLAQSGPEGAIYLTAGKEFIGLFEVVGWPTVRRFEAERVTVTEGTLAELPPEAAATVDQPRNRLRVTMPDKAPAVDGDLGDWDGAEWVEVDARRGITAALAVAEGQLFVAYRTGLPRLLDNALADGLPYAFASGGGLDLMLRPGTAGGGQAERGERGERTREAARAGDVRLVITRKADPLNGTVVAMQYTPVGKRGTAHTFTSPIGETVIGDVRDVGAAIQLAQSGGDYEVAIPLDVLGLRAASGETLRGDLGVLIGNGRETTARVYWNNKTATMTSDHPTEARLRPDLWGQWRVGGRASGRDDRRDGRRGN